MRTADGPHQPISEALGALTAGDERAGAELLPLVYTELRRLAGAMMRKIPPGQTLQATALVHEAYLRLVGADNFGQMGRGHFFRAAARAMRDIMVEQARRKASLKRGGDRKRVDLAEDEIAIAAPREDILALNEALGRLEQQDPRKGDIVLLRYFAGLTMTETAALLGLSSRTIEREWRYIRAWLHRELAAPDGTGMES